LVTLYGVAPPLRLVMEFVPCGDLYNMLHKRRDMAVLTDVFRLRLALDVSRGMKYLQNISPPIAHRDLRSPNIFISSLDPCAPVCAKVADFGLSKQVCGTLQEALDTYQWLLRC